MRYRTKQIILNRGITNDQEALKEMFKLLSHRGNANQNSSEVPSNTHQNS
jgi:mannitol/fructose-specific phosphotransferase system IIA component